MANLIRISHCYDMGLAAPIALNSSNFPHSNAIGIESPDFDIGPEGFFIRQKKLFSFNELNDF